MKHFIITVDTEGDNLWKWNEDTPITTENANYVSRFQDLCERYGFPPVYLINYEMVIHDSLIHFLKEKEKDGKCEIGMHIHAWNSPPTFDLPNRYGGNPYITEYPKETQEEKLRYLKGLIEEKTGVTPVSFRSGRWATDQQLFELLDKLGFLVDCSITPGISYSNDKGRSIDHGNSYVNEIRTVHNLCGRLIEVPMTTARIKTPHGKTLKNRARNILLGKDVWLRPAINSADEMISLIKETERKGLDYLEFMIHSSELMPGGSPYTKDEVAVESFYEKMEKVFEYVSKDYTGITLRDFYGVVQST